MAKLLLIEDDPDLANVISEWLQFYRFSMELADEGETASTMLRGSDYDLVILDLGLPNVDGVDLLATLRSTNDSTPVLIVSGRDSIDSKVACLEMGADDYITKPFHMRELVSRARALVRRSTGCASNLICLADITLNIFSQVVTRYGAEIRLAPQEFALLEFLMRHPNKAFPSKELLDRVWNRADADLGLDTVRSCVKRLRRKLEHPQLTNPIETHSGGYRFYAPELIN